MFVRYLIKHYTLKTCIDDSWIVIRDCYKEINLQYTDKLQTINYELKFNDVVIRHCYGLFEIHFYYMNDYYDITYWLMAYNCHIYKSIVMANMPFLTIYRDDKCIRYCDDIMLASKALLDW